MSITVRELVELPHLGISVRAGPAGLDRRVTWAHVSELENPAAWLEGGEIVLTIGIGVPADPEAQCTYVRRLSERGVAAVGIGRDGRAPALTPAMLEEADNLGFPVLEIPFELPFVAITRLVAAANDQSARSRLLGYLRIFETLRTATREGLDPGELFAHVRKVSGFDLFLCSPEAKPLLEGVPTPPPTAAAHIPPPKGQTPAIPGGYLVPVYLLGGVAGYLVALERDGAETAGLIAAQHIATIAAVELSNLYQEREILRRQGAELLAELLTGATGPLETEKRLLSAGFGAADQLAFLAIRSNSPGSDDSIADTSIDHVLANVRIPHLLLAQNDVLLLLVPATPEPTNLVLEAPCDIQIGVSNPFSLTDGLADARRQAQWSLERAAELGEPIVRFSDRQAEGSWLPSDPFLLQQNVDRILGPVIAHDREHGSDLIHSLRVFFTYDGQMERAATSMHVHKNTLSYRLRQVERLAGAKLSHYHDLVDLWLALRGHDLISQSEERTSNLRRLPVAGPSAAGGQTGPTAERRATSSRRKR